MLVTKQTNLIVFELNWTLRVSINNLIKNKLILLNDICDLWTFAIYNLKKAYSRNGHMYIPKKD